MSAPIEVHCPECQATLKLKNTDAVGRRVPCPKCRQPFVIELPADDGLEVLDDFGDFDDLDEFGDDDFGEMEEASAPATRPKPAAKKSSSKAIWIILGSVLGVTGLGVGGYFGARAMGWLGGAEPVAAAAEVAGDAAPAEVPEAAPVQKAAAVVENDNEEFDTHWLPPDAQIVAGINVERLWDSTETQQALKNPAISPGILNALSQLKQETVFGFDEVSKVTLGISGISDIANLAASSSNGEIDSAAMEKVVKEKLIPAFVLHLRSAVTSEQLAAMEAKLEKTTLDGKPVYVFPIDDPQAPKMLVYRADEKTLVFSVERFIKQLIANGDPYTPRPDLAFVDGGQDIVVAVTLPDPVTIPLPPGISGSPVAQNPTIQSLLALNGKLKGLGFGLKGLGAGSNSLKLQGLTSDESGAQSAKTALESAVTLGKQQIAQFKQQAPLAAAMLGPFEAALNTVKITQSGPEFGFDAAIKAPPGQQSLVQLLPMVLPALQASREAARATQCRNNLKLIGLAMQGHRTSQKAFPRAAIAASDGKPLLSWRVAILPYMGENELYSKFKLNEPWDSPSNKALMASIPTVYVCPSGELSEGLTTYRLITQGKSAYKDGKPVSTGALTAVGGESVVPLVVDAGDEHAVAWTAPETFDSADGIRSHHQDGVSVLFVDGHVSSELDTEKLLAAAPDPDDDGSKDQSKFQGAWTVTAASFNGNALADRVNQVYTFQNNRLLMQVRAGQPPSQSTFQINISANPREFDWIQTDKKKFMGLYQFSGNRLRLSVALPGQPRPKTLNEKGPSVLQLSLQRRGGAGTVQRPNSAGSVAATKGATKNAGPQVNSPGANLQGPAKALFQLVANRELVATNPKGERVSIQLNPDGTTRDHLGNESLSYSIKNLSVSWEIDGLINMLEFRTSTPKVGDTCTFQQKKKTDGSTVFGSYQQLKVVEINPAKPKRKAASAIDGTWKIVSAVVSGTPSDLLKGRMLSFAEGRAALNVSKLDAIGYQFTYEADIEAKPAKFRVFLGERPLMTGIYRYQGDRLQLCFVRGEKTKSPTDFTGKGIGHQLYVLESVKVP
jgi:uncharacterized protein (TIGR03067 family)/prepilin-type processing-associated H-X9-DG protein